MPRYFPKIISNKTRLKLLDGSYHTFDSKGESMRYRVLAEKVKDGSITNLEIQKKYGFFDDQYGLVSWYIADFVFVLKNGDTIVEDYKSEATLTKIFKVKKILMKYVYGIDVKVVKNAGEWRY